MASASIYDRWHLTQPHNDPGWNHPDPAQRLMPCKCGRGKNKTYPSKDHGCKARWQVRWKDEAGKACKASFAELEGEDASRHAKAKAAEITNDLNKGTYIDPERARTKFEPYARSIFADRSLDHGSRLNTIARLENHVFPHIGKAAIGELSKRPSAIQSLIARMEKKKLAPATIELVMAHVGLVFQCAIDDNMCAKHPMRSKVVRIPKVPQKKIVPWTLEQIDAQRRELPKQFKATVDVGAGLGMRCGEIFAFSPDDVDWTNKKVKIVRQVKSIKGKLVFALPKGEKTREVPLPEGVERALKLHMKECPPVSCTLPWKTPDGDPVTVRLFFVNDWKRPIQSSGFSSRVWRPAAERAGIIPATKPGEKRQPAREHGMHALRHYFASALLTEGEAIQAVSEWMGHHSPTITLNIYAHFMPKSTNRMRSLMDKALGYRAGVIPGFHPVGVSIEELVADAVRAAVARGWSVDQIIELLLGTEQTARKVPALAL
jgi:integrase